MAGGAGWPMREPACAVFLVEAGLVKLAHGRAFPVQRRLARSSSRSNPRLYFDMAKQKTK